MLKVQRGPWKICADLYGETIHIRPRADLWWHALDARCWCKPDVAKATSCCGDVVATYVHHAADGRI